MRDSVQAIREAHAISEAFEALNNVLFELRDNKRLEPLTRQLWELRAEALRIVLESEDGAASQEKKG